MLKPYEAPVFTYDDRVLFDLLIPYDHWTRRADLRVDFPALRQSIQHHFSEDGRPAVEPVLCLARTLSIAIPSGLGLIAQARNKLLTSVEHFSADRVAVERVRLKSIRTTTYLQSNEVRLVARVEHLRDILEWVTTLSPPEEADSNAKWQTLLKSIEIAQKSLNGHDDPKAPHKLRSTVDSDARRGKHGDTPKEPSNHGRFTTLDFKFSEDGCHATCPAGHESQYRQRDDGRHKTSFRFAKDTCDACPLMQQCIGANPKYGRTATLNDYEPEYEILRQRKLTEEYAAVKAEHPKVERRLGELVNRHGGRRARYRGLARVQVQKLIEGTVHNMNRLLRLLEKETGFAIV